MIPNPITPVPDFSSRQSLVEQTVAMLACGGTEIDAEILDYLAPLLKGMDLEDHRQWLLKQYRTL